MDSNSYTSEFAAPRLEDFQVEQLVGEWELTVVATRSPRADSVATGTLALRPTPAELRVDRYSLYGWSDIDLGRAAHVSLAHSPAQRDPAYPGVQLLARDDQVTMDFGNSIQIRPDGWIVKTTDSGVLFTLFAATDEWMTGWWNDGGRSSARSQGYFCARRFGS